jgi:hypothetical protein
LKHGDPAVAHLADQVDGLMIVSRCNCDCRTVYFAMKGNPASRKGEQIVNDWLAQMDSDLFGVVLFELDGRISSLEVYSCSGRVKEFGLPNSSMLLGYDPLSVDQLAAPPSGPS